MLTDFVVSTEDREVGEIAETFGANVINQPMASDTSTSGEVCRYALETVERCCLPYQFVVCLHPTSPIRDPKHIDQAIEMLAGSDAPALASVMCRKRSYSHNASIYVMRAEWLLSTGQHFCDESIPFLMDAPHSVDIDTEHDFKLAELYLHGSGIH